MNTELAAVEMSITYLQKRLREAQLRVLDLELEIRTRQEYADGLVWAERP